MTKRKAMETLKSQIEQFIALNERFRAAYFWTPPSSASERRRYESKNSRTLIFDYNGHHYEFNFSVDCSCRNIYVRRDYKKDGKPTTITVLKNLLKTI